MSIASAATGTVWPGRLTCFRLPRGVVDGRMCSCRELHVWSCGQILRIASERGNVFACHLPHAGRINAQILSRLGRTIALFVDQPDCRDLELSPDLERAGGSTDSGRPAGRLRGLAGGLADYRLDRGGTVRFVFGTRLDPRPVRQAAFPQDAYGSASRLGAMAPGRRCERLTTAAAGWSACGPRSESDRRGSLRSGED